MNIYTIGLLISIVVYLVVGTWAGRKVRHLDDYFVAGRNAPTLLIVGTLIASFISTNAFMGESGQAYTGYGGVVLLLTAINVTGYVAGGLYFGRFLRRSRALTVAAFFGHRFDSARVQVAAGVTIILGCTGYVTAVSQGASTIVHEITGLPAGVTLLIAWLSYTGFTLYAGSRGVVITDTIMFLLFSAVAFLGLAFIVDSAGGWAHAIGELIAYEDKPGILTWHGVNTPDSTWTTPGEALTYAIILGLAWSMVVAVSPWQASRYLMARDEHTVIRSATIAAGFIMLFYLALMISGAAVNLIEPGIEPAQEVLVWSALNVLPTFVGVALLSGIMAAALSSASTFLSLIGFSASNDIFPHHADDERKRLSLSRLAMLVCGVAALALAWLVPKGYLFWITYFAGTLFASSWGPVGFMSVWSRRITEAGAFWGIIAGLAGNVLTNLVKVVGEVDLPEILNPILVGVAASLTVIILVSRNTQVTDTERRRREELHETPAEERSPARIRRTVKWSAAVVVLGVAMTVGLVLGYALPFGMPIWFPLVMGLSVVVSGAWAWLGVRRAYR